MLGQLHFDDHIGFQRNTVAWTVAGAAGALVAMLARHYVAPGLDHLLLFGFIGAGLGVASGLLRAHWSQVALGALVGGGLGSLMATIATVAELGNAAPWLGAAAAGAGLGVLWGPERAPRGARAVGYALIAVLGLYVTASLVLTRTPVFDLLGTPGVQDAVTGALMGFFLSLGGVVGRLRLDQDPVLDLWGRSREALSGDMANLAEQGVRLYEEIRDRITRRRREAQGQNLGSLDEAERVARETALRLVRLAARWCEIETSFDDAARPRLEARRAATAAKLKEVTDSVLIAEYTAVLHTIDEQLQSFSRIDIARERLIARLHRCLASLERVSLMVLQLSTSDAQDASLSIQPELERLDEMSEALSWQSLSVDDLCGLTMSPTSPATPPQDTNSVVEPVEADVKLEERDASRAARDVAQLQRLEASSPEPMAQEVEEAPADHPAPAHQSH